MLTETERASLTATFDSIITRDGSDGVREMQQLLRARARKQRPGRPALPKVVPWSIYMVVEDLRESEGISIKTACDRLASCKFHVLSMPARSPITGSVSRLQQWCVIDDDMEHFRPLLRDLNLIALVRDWVPPNPPRLRDLYYWGRELARPVRASTKRAKNRLNLVAAGCVLAASSQEIRQKTAIHLVGSS